MNGICDSLELQSGNPRPLCGRAVHENEYKKDVDRRKRDWYDIKRSEQYKCLDGRKCRNWQTSKTKDLVPAMACGFKSHLPQRAGTSDEVSAFFVLFGVSRNIEKRSEPGAAESISFLYIFMFVQRRQYVKYIQEAGPRITARLFLPPAGGGFSPVKTKGFYL